MSVDRPLGRSRWPRVLPSCSALVEFLLEHRTFEERLVSRRDVEHGLSVTLEHFRSREEQQRALNILQFKLDVLWSMLDAMSMAYELQRPPYHTVTAERIWHRGIAL